MEKRLILTINPGSTSTKFALFEENYLIFNKTLRHTLKELSCYAKITDQLSFRKNLIMDELTRRKTDFSKIVIVIGRGGLLKPIESGIYNVNDQMKQDLTLGLLGEHVSNLGGLIADQIASHLPNAIAYIADPVVVDELQPVARLSGHPEIERISIFHALNQKAVARIYSASIGRNYDDLNLIVVHMGGGISVGAHKKGKVIDVNNALDGDGPFSPERSGGLPSGQLAYLCFSGKYSFPTIKSMLAGKGGMVAYLGTNDFKEICRMADKGDQKALLVKNASSYQIGKEIGAMAAVLDGKVDAIILTGGMAHQKSVIKFIESMVGFITKIVAYPGEYENEALAFNGLLVLNKEIKIKTYT